MLTNVKFIKPGAPYDASFHPYENPSVIFYREFDVSEMPKSATVYVCALGIGYVYLNGEKISEDLFPCPPSDYEKTLWYNTYDVTRNLRNGKNTLAVLCGNGFLSEDMFNTWDSHTAAWRDYPKLALKLDLDGSTAVTTDESWLCTLKTPYIMNRYRMGVIYDSRRKMPCDADFSAEGFENAIVDPRAPKGAFRAFEGEPIREKEYLEPMGIYKRADGARVWDFGFNSSGYVRLRVKAKSGTTVTLTYSEEIHGDTLTPKMNGNERFYPEGEFAVERFICNGEENVWSTLFSYYGFRYVTVETDDPDADISLTGVFVYQDVKRTGFFKCSDPFLNKLFECGIRSTKSNLFHMPTDCPTREKYGWMNDAQASAEQILTDFDASRVLSRWCYDICDALDDEKGLPGIVPTHGWGYKWGNGPVSDGSLFEQPWRIYLHTGDRMPLVRALPYFRRYFKFVKTREDGRGYIDFGLHDWANPEDNVEKTPHQLINEIYRVKFYRIASVAARLAGEDETEFSEGAKISRKKIIRDFFDENGRCTVNEQTAAAMLIYHGIFPVTGAIERPVIYSQLEELIEKNGYRHDCGMVGLRHLYMALSECGRQDMAMKIITADGYPCYRKWLDQGATCLWEKWHREESKNHQMYSDVISYLMKTAGGICPDESEPCYMSVTVEPYFFDGLDFVQASVTTVKGEVAVDWKRDQGGIRLKITAPTDGYVYRNGKALPKGTSEFLITQ
jgi:alpha-L-rhamnosidase